MAPVKVVYISIQSSDSSTFRTGADLYQERTGNLVDLFHVNGEAVDDDPMSPYSTNPQTGIKIELPGTRVGLLTVSMSMGDTPESEISFCTYNGNPIDADKLEEYYIMEK